MTIVTAMMFSKSKFCEKFPTMKKLLLVFDGNNFSQGIVDFARHINAADPVFATGLFLPAVEHAELLYSFGGIPAGPIYMNEVVPGDPENVRQNIARFEQLCRDNNMQYAVHQPDVKRIPDVIREETRFADVLVTDGTAFARADKQAQQDYASHMLHKAECPVVIVPGQFTEPQSLVFAYDGSEQSVYAMKQFNYLFPAYGGLPALIVHFAHGNTQLPQRDKIKELAGCYYSTNVVTQLDIHKKEDISGWLASNDAPFFVSGSYGRTPLSELVHGSFSSEVISGGKFMAFIAHK